jgi:hypothetical protein
LWMLQRRSVETAALGVGGLIRAVTADAFGIDLSGERDQAQHG